MDTYVTIRLYPPAAGRDAAAALIDSAAAQMRKIDSLASSYQPESEIGWLHAHAARPDLPLTPEMTAMLTAALRIDSLSSGAFTPAIGALTGLWGFGRREIMRVPSAEERQQALQHVGRRGVRLRPGGITFTDTLTRIDLGGAAKGYAVDEAIALLQRHGITDAQVDAGGDLRTIASARTAGKRRVYVRHPLDADAFYGRFPLDEGAVATSGDYERYFEAEGIRYHHLLDPWSGMPAGGCRSVTIVGRTAVDCDALATAVFVLGPDRGMELIESLPGIEGLIIYEQAGSLQEKISRDLAPRFERLP
ncbi:MAG TPA: FAD:protein FMN transferase [bacterium]|nr:FAD:protein FMN transferase [bacterium]